MGDSQKQAVIMVIVVAAAGLAIWSSQKNQVTTFGGLKGVFEDEEYRKVMDRYAILEKEVQGNLTGLGMPPRMNARIKEWRHHANQLRAGYDDRTQGDMIRTLDQTLQISGQWLDRDASLKASQRALVRQMKGAPHSGQAVRNPLRKAVKTGNSTFGTPAFNSQALVRNPTPVLQQVAGINSGQYFGDGSSFQPGQVSFLQGNAINDGQDVLMLGGSQKLDFSGSSSALTFSQGSSGGDTDMLAAISEMEVENGMESPPAYLALEGRPSTDEDPPLTISRSPSPGTDWDKWGRSDSLDGGSEGGTDPNVEAQRPKPVAKTKVVASLVPYQSDFNQQGSFSAGTDVDLLSETKREALDRAKKGQTVAANKLQRQANSMEYGAALPPALPPSGPVVSIDNAYMNKLASFAGKISRTNNKDHIGSYIGSIERLIPEPWSRSGVELWQFAKPGEDAWKSPEMRERNRVLKEARAKISKGRQRSDSFALPPSPEQPKRQRTIRDVSRGGAHTQMDLDKKPGKGGN